MNSIHSKHPGGGGEREVPCIRCEACGAPIPLEHQLPKPRCRRCGWLASCCNPEEQSARRPEG